MQENKNTNQAPACRDGMTFFDCKNTDNTISSVVKTEIYPKQRKKGRESFRTREKHRPTAEQGIQTDPYGSYTGTPVHRDEAPVQDVDDL